METYISIDVESDGPSPSANSMLSFGAVALNVEKEVLGKFSINLHEQALASPNPETMEWWSQNQEAYDKTRIDCVDPLVAMNIFANWGSHIQTRHSKPILLEYPGGYDFAFVYTYITRFADDNPFGFSSLSVKSYMMGMLKKKKFRDCTKRNMPKRWFDNGLPHTHVGIDDALEQGCMWINILRENLGLDPVPHHTVTRDALVWVDEWNTFSRERIGYAYGKND